VLGEYSAEVIQMISAYIAANMRIEQIAELQPAFPTFTEAAQMAAQQLTRQLGIAPTPHPGATCHRDRRAGREQPRPTRRARVPELHGEGVHDDVGITAALPHRIRTEPKPSISRRWGFQALEEPRDRLAASRDAVKARPGVEP
jgi:hypothetical protein